MLQQSNCVGNWLSKGFQGKTSLNTSKQKHGWHKRAFSVSAKNWQYSMATQQLNSRNYSHWSIVGSLRKLKAASLIDALKMDTYQYLNL